MRTMHLFAGGGGGLLADLILGHTPIVAVEWDKYACDILRERAKDGWFEGLHVWEGDVRLFDPSKYKGVVDCIHAGFPCQPFSQAGNRKGSEDVRGDLFAEVLRCVEAVRPKYIFLENVAGLLTSQSSVCVCGWPYRRRGVHEDSQADEENNINLHPNNSDNHVEQGGDFKTRDGIKVWWKNLQYGNEESKLGELMDVAYQWGCSDGFPSEDLSISDTEKASSRFIDGVASTEKITTSTEKRNAQVVGRSKNKSAINEGKDAHTESEGFNCPECRRRMVSGARSIRYLDAVLWSLSAYGYDAKWTTLRASDVGAPHQRDRWWLRAEWSGLSSHPEHDRDGWRKQQSQSLEEKADVPNAMLTWQWGNKWEGKTKTDTLANTRCELWQEGNAERLDTNATKRSHSDLHNQSGGEGFISDTDSAQCERKCKPIRVHQEHANVSKHSWWEVEPDVGRVANGVANWSHKLKALGNGQVPLQAALAWKLLEGKPCN